MKEIGSEFWIDKNYIKDKDNTLQRILDFGEDKQFLLSGRTAIRYVLKDIAKPIKTVYMPSYCCESMVQPFIDADIEIYFYDVIANGSGIEYRIDYEKDIDVFLAISYFGFSSSAMDSIIKNFKDKNIITIEDITHRLLMKQNHSNKTDYCIGSLRKWFAIPTGGFAIKMDGDFRSQNMIDPPIELIDKKTNAMIEKAKYMLNFNDGDNQNEISKRFFLEKFSEFNVALKRNYKNILMDDLSSKILARTDIEEIKKTRFKNAQYLYTCLEESEYVRLLFNQLNIKDDCPLFVPVMVREDIREALQKHLIHNNIFCPIHWPAPSVYRPNIRTEILYNEELSLICDQRYSIDDMKKIIITLGEFIKKL